jgi:hypothetical protein
MPASAMSDNPAHDKGIRNHPPLGLVGAQRQPHVELPQATDRRLMSRAAIRDSINSPARTALTSAIRLDP